MRAKGFAVGTGDYPSRSNFSQMQFITPGSTAAPACRYLPWWVVFVAVLLLESMLPVATASEAAMGGKAAAGGKVDPGERGDSVRGPALVIYHILGVRKHVVSSCSDMRA